MSSAPGGGPRRFRRRRGLRAIAAGGLLLGVAWRFWPCAGDALEHYPAATHLLDREGHPLRILPGPEALVCDPISLEATGDWAWKAIVAVEDKRFFRHPGLDPVAIGRAVLQNLAGGRVISGASTLSSQVIRMTEPRPRTLPAKIVEGWRALQMDGRLSKPEILEQYLNRAPMGGPLTGVASASRAYFGKAPRDLDLAEAALLMGLPQSPSRLRPTRHPERARERRHRVLARMRACGYITEDQFQAADEAPVVLRVCSLPFAAPHFCELARTRFAEAPRCTEAPHRVRTTLDPALQALAEQTLGRDAEDRRQRGVTGGAIVILEVATGAVRALAGSPDFFDVDAAGQVNGAIAPRSPGSALKPFAYALAMDRGLVTAVSVIDDEPIAYRDYRPENFDHRFNGPVTVREALAQSLNIPALRVAEAVGLAPLLNLLRDVGLTTLDRPADAYGLSLVLGTAEVTLLDLTAAYGALARGGSALPWRVWEAAPASPPRPVLSPEAAYLVTDILEGETRLIPLRGHAADTRAPRVAWKTGTSSGQRDAWTVAYNPEYVVGVWIGNPSGAGAALLVLLHLATGCFV
ncbi:MAG: penicillin-binding protein 1C, partial [Anaerolineae bacterium]